MVYQPDAAPGKVTSVQFDLRQVSPVDLGEWHRQTGELVSKRLLKSTANVKKLHTIS
jgi:hypothetical protein